MSQLPNICRAKDAKMVTYCVMLGFLSGIVEVFKVAISTRVNQNNCFKLLLLGAAAIWKLYSLTSRNHTRFAARWAAGRLYFGLLLVHGSLPGLQRFWFSLAVMETPPDYGTGSKLQFDIQNRCPD